MLNYVLQQERPVDFGAMVASRVFSVVLGTARTGGLVFPHVITDICASFGVQIRDGERNYSPLSFLTCVPPYVHIPDEDVQFAEAEFDDDDEDDDEYQPEQESEPEYAEGMQGHGYGARFDEVISRIDRVREDVTSLQLDVSMLQQEHQRTHYDAAHTRQQNDYMHAMFDRFAAQFNINTDGVPPWPQYQPPQFGDQ